MIKKRWIFILLVSFIVFNLVYIIMLVAFFSQSEIKVSGKANNLGIVSLFIEDWREINITSPINATYNFLAHENYTIYLNVSANFVVDSWWYTLNDKRNSLVVYQDVPFVPNSTFNAVRWENEIIVYANDSTGEIKSKSVSFFVNIPSSAPIIHYIPPNIFVCEKNYTSVFFNVTDIDEEIPTPSIHPAPPASPFYTTYSRAINSTVKSYEIFSGMITKLTLGGSNVGWRSFLENVSVNDGKYSDSRQTNITLIEINNAPSITPIGVQTVWGIGDNRTFYHELNAVDPESGTLSDGNLTPQRIILNSSGRISPIFNISRHGIINFTANKNQTGTYRVWIYVYDNGLKNYHPNITNHCNVTQTNKSSMINFTLTVTNENRPPYITSYYPINTSLTAYEGESLYFNATMRDPDLTPLDSYWYFDDKLLEYQPGFDNGNFSEILPVLGFNSAGNHTIRINVTDGNLSNSYDSFVWNISIIDVPVAISSGTGGGGGGTGGTPICKEKWGCQEWNECKNLRDSLNNLLLTKKEHDTIQKSCLESFWNEEYCGFQRRDCTDVNNCSLINEKPKLMQACHYTKNPNCFDGIKNCHDNSCEVLTDCGGPCNACPTCSDKIKNQDEEEIDCGGPCKPCYKERPTPKTPFRYAMASIILLLLIILMYISFRYLRMHSK